ncbi:amino acid permease [Halococcus morrhuae DSM 1307]|uniref:Amino acid permease n=1 Tax=Halococcus morrhuae DSM 1307 TaxID=931277 RepID=M0MJ28_HALMO|nr:APC family permease [Halococcus morrhuae]EMA45707.1 amino acid permease [Halococcus morrhuae DSM 1307]
MGTAGPLSRNLSWIHSVAVIVGTMVGAGIFVVTGTAAEIMGPAVPLGFLAGLPIVFSTALVYAVFMSGPLGEHPGGAYMHISRTWNSTLAGYVFIWLKVVAFIGAQAVFAIGFGNAIRYWPVFRFLPAEWWAIAFLTLLFVLHLVGVDVFGQAQAILTGLLVAVLLLLGLPGLFQIDPGNFSPLFPEQLYADGLVGPFVAGTSALFFSYIGFESLAQTAGETENPRKTLPRVFAGSVLFIGLLYLLVSVVVLGILPWEQVAGSETPLTDAAATYFPVGTAGIVAVGSLLAYATTANAGYMSPSRILYALGRDRLLPDVLTHVNDRFGTPDVGLTLTWAIAVAFVLTSTFSYALNISLAALLFMYVAHALSLVALPHVNPTLYERSALQFGPVTVAVIGLFSAGSMLVFLSQTISLADLGPAIQQLLAGNVGEALLSSSLLLLGIWLAIGLLVYAGYRLSIDGELPARLPFAFLEE